MESVNEERHREGSWNSSIDLFITKDIISSLATVVSSSIGIGQTVIDAQGELKALQRDTVIWMSSASRIVPTATGVISETTISFLTTATILPINSLRSSVQGVHVPPGANNLLFGNFLTPFITCTYGIFVVYIMYVVQCLYSQAWRLREEFSNLCTSDIQKCTRCNAARQRYHVMVLV